MRLNRILLILSLLLLLVIHLYAEQQKVLIIYPLESGGISPEVAARANNAFEQGLVKTGAYQVINGNDLGLLLEAQGTMLSGLFDDSKVLTIGRMLPAELVAKGTIEAAGDGLLIHLKILDLASGAVLKSESGSGIIPAEIEKAVQQLVFRLTGEEGSPADTGNRYVSLTVTADYKDAVVYLDGKAYGTTPLLIDNFPAGSYFLEIKKESLYYSEALTVDGNKTVYGSLRQRFGSILISTKPGDAFVVIGDTNYGKSRFIDQIPAWNQIVILKKPGFFWKGLVPVLANQTVKIDVVLNPTSTLVVNADKDIFSQFYGDNLSYEFQGSWEIKDIPPGNYVLESVKTGYKKYKEIIDIGINEKLELSPQMVITEEVQIFRQELKTELSLINEELMNIAIPEIYRENPVPALDLISIKNTFFSFIPMLDFFILFDDPLLPSLEKKKYQTISGIQFGAGILFQLSLAALLLFDNEVVRTTSVITAAVSGCTNIGLGIYAGAEWNSWTKANKEIKSKQDALKKRLAEIKQLLPSEPTPP